jgi:hypothetical protein
VIAAEYDRFTERLPETCTGLKVDPAALEYKDFTYVAAGWVEAGQTGEQWRDEEFGNWRRIPIPINTHRLKEHRSQCLLCTKRDSFYPIHKACIR